MAMDLFPFFYKSNAINPAAFFCQVGRLALRWLLRIREAHS